LFCNIYHEEHEGNEERTKNFKSFMPFMVKIKGEKCYTNTGPADSGGQDA
jgi:hypothetical protein